MKKKFPKGIAIFCTLLILSIIIGIDLDLSLSKLFQGLPNISILSAEAFPPDTSIIATSMKAMLETLEIAFIGTFFGTLISLPLGILASRNIFKNYITIPIRKLLAVIRTLPALLWAIIFVIVVGLGPFAGILATIMYTTGYLSKLQYETIEGINPEPLEALSGIGSSKIQLIRFVILPEAANNLISQILFIFEYNVRATSILGFVGAGGIGFYIMGYLKLLEYNKVLTLLLIVLFTIIIIDYLSTIIRDRYLTTSKNN